MRFFNYIYEGIEDKGIFKGIFMVGNAGAGKTRSITKIKSGQIEPRIVNTDKFFSLFDKEDWNQKWNKIAGKVKRISKENLYLYLNSMLPLFIDSTSSDPNALAFRKGLLEKIGYDTGAIFVSTDLDVSIDRVMKRAKETGREVDENFVRKSWERVQMLKPFYKKKFSFFMEINNNDGEFTEEIIIKSYNKVNNFFLSKLKNPIGIENINTIKENKQKYLVPTIYSKSELMSIVDKWY